MSPIPTITWGFVQIKWKANLRLHCTNMTAGPQVFSVCVYLPQTANTLTVEVLFSSCLCTFMNWNSWNILYSHRCVLAVNFPTVSSANWIHELPLPSLYISCSATSKIWLVFSLNTPLKRCETAQPKNKKWKVTMRFFVLFVGICFAICFEKKTDEQ